MKFDCHTPLPPNPFEIALNNSNQIKDLSQKVKISADPNLLWGPLTLFPGIQICFALYILKDEAS